MHNYAIVAAVICTWAILNDDYCNPTKFTSTMTLAASGTDVIAYTFKYLKMIKSENTLLQLEFESKRYTLAFTLISVSLYALHRIMIWTTLFIAIKASPFSCYGKPYLFICTATVAAIAKHCIKQLKHEWINNKFDQIDQDEDLER